MWWGKEHDWVNRNVFGYLIKYCTPGGPQYDVAQIGIEIGVLNRQIIRRTAFCEMWLSEGNPGPPVETLDGIAEPRPVARTPPFAIGLMFPLRRKLLGSIGSIFKTRIRLSDTM